MKEIKKLKAFSQNLAHQFITKKKKYIFNDLNLFLANFDFSKNVEKKNIKLTLKVKKKRNVLEGREYVKIIRRVKATILRRMKNMLKLEVNSQKKTISNNFSQYVSKNKFHYGQETFTITTQFMSV